jgi:hypothetical protein
VYSPGTTLDGFPCIIGQPKAEIGADPPAEDGQQKEKLKKASAQLRRFLILKPFPNTF